MVKSLFLILFLCFNYSFSAVCDCANCQVVMFDDFNRPTTDEDPACYTKIPNCSSRPEWGNTGACLNLDSQTISQTALLNKCRWKLWQGYSVYGREKTYRWDTSQ